MAVYAVVVY